LVRVGAAEAVSVADAPPRVALVRRRRRGGGARRRCRRGVARGGSGAALKSWRLLSRRYVALRVATAVAAFVGVASGMT
jgi:hypothetical protein